MENGYQWTINSTTWNHLRMMWLAVGATEREEINGREETVGQEGAAERERVEERGGTTEQEGKAGSNAATGREGATGREAADEGAKAAERKGTTGREGATERGALDLLRHVYLESSVPFWGPQQGRRVILWESLSPEDQQKCLNDLQDNKEWVI